MVNKVDNSMKLNNQKNSTYRPYINRNQRGSQPRIPNGQRQHQTLTKEQELELELERLFKFNPEAIQLKELPQHKIPSFGLDTECRLKFENFYKKLNNPASAFDELFRKDLRI